MKRVYPYTYTGRTINAPASKSYLQRAIAIACMFNGETNISNITLSNDAKAAIGIANTLGSFVEDSDSRIVVKGRQRKLTSAITIDCGESGLSTRMFSPIAALLSNEVTITGHGSILLRPMDMVIDALTQLGAKVKSNDGKLPLIVTGGINGGTVDIDGSESSQLLTGLLIALPFAQNDSKVIVRNLKSIPYAQMTLDILGEFGVDIGHENYEQFHIKAIERVSRTSSYHVEGDWSGAAFHIVGAALSGEITLSGLNQNSAQADRAVMEVLDLVGAEYAWKNGELTVTTGQLKPFEFDATQCPDLFPPLAALAVGCNGESKIHGIHRLGSKESDRALTIQSEMAKLGVKVVLDGDAMIISPNKIVGGRISSCNDHRIAMMGAVLASISSAPIEIENAEAINKSYPQFFEDLAKV